MPIEVIATIVGVVLTGVLGLIVYNYRSVVTYEIISLSQKFEMTDAGLVISKDGLGSTLHLERITIKNRGLTDISSFSFHLDRTPALLWSAVTSTTSLSKNIVNLNSSQDSLVVETPTFPRGEACVIELAYRGIGGGSEYRDAKSGGGKYKIERQQIYESGRHGMFTGIGWAFATGVAMWIIFRGK